MTAQPALGDRFTRWLDKRIPPGNRITLGQRNVFIFPTRTGFAFGALILTLIVGAINYQSSLIFSVAFLLGSVFLVAILHTFRNLSGVALELAGCREAFVGEDLEILVSVDGSLSPGREGIWVCLPGAIRQYVDLYESDTATVRLFAAAVRRGWQDPGRLLVESYYPLGLLRAWTWVDLAVNVLAYPRPVFTDPPRADRHRKREEGQLIDRRGSDDFVDIRPYQPGDPVKHIMWRSYARTGELAVREYASYVEPRLWLDLDSVEGDLEHRLGVLTGQALLAHRQGREFGLRLGGTDVQPGIGQHHLDDVLKRLALHGL